MRKLALVALLAASSACSSFASSMMNGAADSAGHGVGNAVGERAVAGMPHSAVGMNPAFMNVFMSSIFAMAFSSGGYDIAQVAYKPGEYTRWTGSSQQGKEMTLERALLTVDKEGRQWWKVKWTDEEKKTMVFEGLLDPKQKKFVRMRAKFPDDAEGKEMPVDDATYYQPPQKLTKESIEGATKGSENVTVPAGTFHAKHVVFGGVDGTHEWWTSTKVPGGAVKQLYRAPSKSSSEEASDSKWQMELSAYGKDAKTELASF